MYISKRPIIYLFEYRVNNNIPQQESRHFSNGALRVGWATGHKMIRFIDLK